MEQLCFDVNAMQAMHVFGDALEDGIKSIKSEFAEFTPVRDAKDCIGRHWYGMRCKVTCKRFGIGFYLHIGLIYYPTTRKGLMVELDEQNNGSIYSSVLNNIVGRKEFEINRDEPEYFKLFMPDEDFENMSYKERGEQVSILRQYVQAAGEAIVMATYQRGFKLTYKNLEDALGMVNAFEKSLLEVQSEISKVDINYADKDNFGQYAEGYRYYLSDINNSFKMYAYFGAIYSYKKSPAGIFVEIDWFSNQDVFQVVYDNMEQSNSYEFSSKEPKFIKLFMKESMVEQFNQSDYEAQIETIKTFLKECNDQMVKAGIKGGARNDR